MPTGTIKKLTDRFYGFIGAEGQEKDLFFHGSSVQGCTFEELREGDAVTFEVTDGDKGPAATNVQRT